MQPFPVAVSVAVARLVTGAPRPVELVAITPPAFYLATGDPELPAVCLCTTTAVRLPCALVLGADVALPRVPEVSGRMGGGRLVLGGFQARVARWWRPPRPRGTGRPPAPPAARPEATLADLSRAVEAGGPLDQPVLGMLGRGPGLTPLGDDRLAGYLVGLYATGHPGAPRLAETVRRLAPGRTTLVSVAMLAHAARGECIRELDAVLRGVPGAEQVLLRIGHTSGTGLLQGVQAAR